VNLNRRGAFLRALRGPFAHFAVKKLLWRSSLAEHWPGLQSAIELPNSAISGVNLNRPGAFLRDLCGPFAHFAVKSFFCSGFEDLSCRHASAVSQEESG
jgi:hypothetical protein